MVRKVDRRLAIQQWCLNMCDNLPINSKVYWVRSFNDADDLMNAAGGFVCENG